MDPIFESPNYEPPQEKWSTQSIIPIEKKQLPEKLKFDNNMMKVFSGTGTSSRKERTQQINKSSPLKSNFFSRKNEDFGNTQFISRLKPNGLLNFQNFEPLTYKPNRNLEKFSQLKNLKENKNSNLEKKEVGKNLETKILNYGIINLVPKKSNSPKVLELKKDEFLEDLDIKKNYEKTGMSEGSEESGSEEMSKEELRKELPANFDLDFDESDSSPVKKKMTFGSQEKSSNQRPQPFYPQDQMCMQPISQNRFSYPNQMYANPPRPMMYQPPFAAQNMRIPAHPNNQFMNGGMSMTQNIYNPQMINFGAQQAHPRTVTLKEIEKQLKGQSDHVAFKLLRSLHKMKQIMPEKDQKKVKIDLKLNQKYPINLETFGQLKHFVLNFQMFGRFVKESQEYQYSRIHEIASNILVKTKYTPTCPQVSVEEKEKILNEIKYERMSSQELNLISLEEKEKSTKFQNYLKLVDLGTLEKIAKKMRDCIYELSFDKFGNYIAQILVERLPSIRKYVMPICKERFEEMMSNEFSSRVLQKLICLGEEEFIKFSIVRFSKNFSLFIKDLSSVIFATKLINQSKNEEDYLFLVKILEKDPKIVLNEPHMMRLLVSIFSQFSDDMLKRMFKPLKKYIWNLLNDKFGNYILQKVIERNIKPFKGIIENLCAKHCQKLILKKYPRYILLRIIENDNTGKFSEKIFYQICFKEDESYIQKKIVWKVETSCLVLLALMKMKLGKLKKLFPKFVELLLKDEESFLKNNQCKSKILTF
jgi:pumilio RNA-binding family